MRREDAGSEPEPSGRRLKAGPVPAVGHPSVAAALAGDAVLVVSPFVLGGSFRDELRPLFVHDAEVCVR